MPRANQKRRSGPWMSGRGLFLETRHRGANLAGNTFHSGNMRNRLRHAGSPSTFSLRAVQPISFLSTHISRSAALKKLEPLSKRQRRKKSILLIYTEVFISSLSYEMTQPG
jgi:hypothetical protein